MSFKVTIRKILMLIAMFYICISLFFLGRYVYVHMNGDSNVKTKDELIKERVSFLKTAVDFNNTYYKDDVNNKFIFYYSPK